MIKRVYTCKQKMHGSSKLCVKCCDVEHVIYKYSEIIKQYKISLENCKIFQCHCNFHNHLHFAHLVLISNLVCFFM